MRIDHIHIKNYRCFGGLTVDFDASMTVLVAPNGQGKTSLLDAVKVALWPFVAGFDLGSTTNDVTGIHIDDVRREQVASHEMDWRLPAEIKADGQIRARQLMVDGVLPDAPPQSPGHLLDLELAFATGVPWRCERYRESVRKGTKTKDATVVSALHLPEVARQLEQRIFSGTQRHPDDLPLLSYYGTGRLWSQKKLTALHERAEPQALSRTFAYRDCLDPASSYKHFAAWFTRVHKAYLQAQIRNLERQFPLDADIAYGLMAPYKAVQQAVDSMLKDHTGWHSLSYSEEYEELVLYHDQYGKLKVSQLSDGLRNMVAMVGDIAHRCYKLNAHLGERAPQRTHGVVLIDEVDMHLHPSWQQTVLTDLHKTFPGLQFIVTTHSPQVLSTVSREHIRLLRETKEGRYEAVLPEFSPLAHEAGDALARVMGTHPHAPLPLRETVLQFEQVVRAGQEGSDKAQELKKQLDEAGYQIHESHLAMWRLLARRKSKG